jgi:hypothetical protein
MVPRPKPFNIQIAEISVAVTCSNPDLQDRALSRYRDFLGDSSPAMSLTIHLEGQLRESPLLDREMTFTADSVKFSAPGFQGRILLEEKRGSLAISSRAPLDELDYFLRVVYALLAFEQGGLLFHSAGVVRDQKAFLFFGHSGVGKTTVARLSRPYLLLNDDLILLKPDARGWQAHATPFYNPTQLSPTAAQAPLAGLFHLVQDQVTDLKPLPKAHSLAEMISNTPVLPLSPLLTPLLLKRLETLLDSTPIYNLHFRKDASFWTLIAEEFPLS